MMGVIDHLQKVTKREDFQNKDSIWEAMFALSVAYGLNIQNTATKERYPLHGHSMIDIFKAGLEQLSGIKSDSTDSAADSQKKGADAKMEVEIPTPVTDPAAPGFDKFVKFLRESTAFFNGADEGTPEFESKIKRARERYDEKLATKQQNGEKATRQAPEVSPEVSAEVKEEAEALKVEGNNKLKAKDYNAALDLYTKAIELDGDNAVFYSNRAAANLLLRRFTEAVDDCKRAINLDREFLRPRERLAAAYRQLGMTKKEKDVLVDALQISPGNADIQRRLADAEAQLSGGASSAPGPSQGIGSLFENMPSDPNQMSEIARSMGVDLPDGALDSFMSSGGMERVGNMIRENPNIMQQAMQAMMSGGLPGGFPGGPPPGTNGQGG